MRRLACLPAFALAWAVSPVATHAQSQTTPSVEVKKLAIMVGTFRNEGEVKAGAFGPNSPPMKVSGTDECSWTADGFGLLCTESVDIGGTKETETFLQYYDPISGKYELHGVRNTGEVENQAGTVNGDTWTWPGQSTVAGKVFHQRYTIKFVSNDAYEYTDEWAEGDKPLEVGLSGKCTRIAARTDGDAQTKFSPAQQEVIDAHEARTEASNKRDQVAYSRYVADDCIFSTDDGDAITKVQLMAHVRKLPTEYDHSMNPRDYIVHVYGDTAVLNLRYTDHEQFSDSDIVSEMRMTETYIKQDGRWLLIARQWGKIPMNFRKPVAVDTSIYKDYVGQYEWRPGDDVETISLKDRRLWTQSGKDVGEFLPLGNDTFFLRTELGTNRFIRDAHGRVTGYTYRDADGQEVHVKKIK